jgi:pimeloyl-ACP methyl ester carboxylesterase
MAAGNQRATVMDLLPTQADGFFNSGGLRIHYVEAGQGPAVVLIHGYIANADRHWLQTGIFANLADHRVIALDCRGHGLSDKPTKPEAYGMEMANDVVRLLDHLGIADQLRICREFTARQGWTVVQEFHRS